MIRNMQVEDIKAVARLDVRAFSGYWRETGRGDSLPIRRRENILACLSLFPQGCFVAAEPDPVGYVFSRAWGEVGWIGTFGIHPDYQGRGIGKALLQAGAKALRYAGCQVIGLETMADSPYNIGFYSRLGFMPSYPTICLAKKTRRQTGCPDYELIDQTEEMAKLAAVSRISRESWSLLDLRVEAQNAITFGWGEILLIGSPEPWAAAILRTKAKREGEAENFCDVRAMAVSPGHQHRFEEALLAIEAFATSRDLAEVFLYANAYQRQALQRALELGYRVSLAMLRMLLTPEAPGPRGIELCRWAM